MVMTIIIFKEDTGTAILVLWVESNSNSTCTVRNPLCNKIVPGIGSFLFSLSAGHSKKVKLDINKKPLCAFFMTAENVRGMDLSHNEYGTPSHP